MICYTATTTTTHVCVHIHIHVNKYARFAYSGVGRHAPRTAHEPDANRICTVPARRHSVRARTKLYTRTSGIPLVRGGNTHVVCVCDVSHSVFACHARRRHDGRRARPSRTRHETRDFQDPRRPGGVVVGRVLRSRDGRSDVGGSCVVRENRFYSATGSHVQFNTLNDHRPPVCS